MPIVGNRLRSALLFIAAAPLLARNPAAAAFDMSHLVTIRGIVTRVEWTNPHAYIYVNVQEANGAVHEWGMEIRDIAALKRYGWTRNTVRPGDAIACTGGPARSGVRLIWGTMVQLPGGAKRRL